MNPQQLALSPEGADVRKARTTGSYLIDAVAMAAYLLAIAVCAMFLDIPHPGVVAALIAFVTLVLFNPMSTKRVRDSAGSSANL